MLARTDELVLLWSEKLKRNSKPHLTNLVDFGQTFSGERENAIVLSEDTFTDSPRAVVINDPHFSVSDLGENSNLRTEQSSEAREGLGDKKDAFDNEQEKK